MGKVKVQEHKTQKWLPGARAEVARVNGMENDHTELR